MDGNYTVHFPCLLSGKFVLLFLLQLLFSGDISCSVLFPAMLCCCCLGILQPVRAASII